MAALSTTETPSVTGYGVLRGNGVLHVRLNGDPFGVGGSLSFKMAREMALTILGMTKGEAGDE